MKPQVWNFENTGYHAGVFNMEHDGFLVQQMRDKDHRPTLRVYGWKPHAISLGWNQSMDDIDVRRAEAGGVDIGRHSQHLDRIVTAK